MTRLPVARARRHGYGLRRTRVEALRLRRAGVRDMFDDERQSV